MWTHLGRARAETTERSTWVARRPRSARTQRHSGGHSADLVVGRGPAGARATAAAGVSAGGQVGSTQLGTATPITTRRAGRAGRGAHGHERDLPAAAAAGVNWCCSMTGPPEPTVPAGPWCRRRHRDDAHENDQPRTRCSSPWPRRPRRSVRTGERRSARRSGRQPRRREAHRSAPLVKINLASQRPLCSRCLFVPAPWRAPAAW